MNRTWKLLTIAALTLCLALAACAESREATDAADYARLKAAVAQARVAALRSDAVRRIDHAILRARAAERSHREQAGSSMRRRTLGWSIGRYSGNRQAAAASMRRATDAAQRRAKLERDKLRAVDAAIAKALGERDHARFEELEKSEREKKRLLQKHELKNAPRVPPSRTPAGRRLRSTSRPSSRPSK